MDVLIIIAAVAAIFFILKIAFKVLKTVLLLWLSWCFTTWWSSVLKGLFSWQDDMHGNSAENIRKGIRNPMRWNFVCP